MSKKLKNNRIFWIFSGGQDADRDADSGHAAERGQLQLAVHEHPMTDGLSTGSGRVLEHGGCYEYVQYERE